MKILIGECFFSYCRNNHGDDLCKMIILGIRKKGARYFYNSFIILKPCKEKHCAYGEMELRDRKEEGKYFHRAEIDFIKDKEFYDTNKVDIDPKVLSLLMKLRLEYNYDLS